MRYLKRHHHKIFASVLTASVILSIIFGGTYGPPPTQAATYTFTQTNWAGGPALIGVEEATSSVAAHPTNQTG